MRIHSDVLTADDLRRAVSTTGLHAEGVWLENCSTHGSRSHARAFEVSLRAKAGRDRHGKARRAPNSGSYGADTGKAATYDEWGYWIGALFALDPAARIGYYDTATHPYWAAFEGKYDGE